MAIRSAGWPLVFSTMAALLCAAPGAQAQMQSAPQVIAYVFPDGKPVDTHQLSAASLTRINYAFLSIRNGQLVEGSPEDAANLAALCALRKQYPRLAVVGSVGGWLGSGQFSDTALTPASRQRFVDSVMVFLHKYNLDGLDVDWEFPGMPGAGNPFRPADKQNYTALLRALRDRFDAERGKHLVLSVAVNGENEFLSHVEPAEVAKAVDSVNLMAYDYYEPSDDHTTGNHAPLYTDPHDPKGLSADASVKAYEAAGVPSSKLVLGVPFYGHAWSGVANQDHGLFQPGKNSFIGYTNYQAIATTMLGHGYERYWDAAASAPTLYNPATHVFVSYDDPQSMRLKGRYARNHHLGGVMFWDSEGDPSGVLLGALRAGLAEKPEQR